MSDQKRKQRSQNDSVGNSRMRQGDRLTGETLRQGPHHPHGKEGKTGEATMTTELSGKKATCCKATSTTSIETSISSMSTTEVVVGALAPAAVQAVTANAPAVELTGAATLQHCGDRKVTVASDSGLEYDQVRHIVEEEGRSARNLVTWHVPLEGDLLKKGTESNLARPDGSGIEGGELRPSGLRSSPLSPRRRQNTGEGERKGVCTERPTKRGQVEMQLVGSKPESKPIAQDLQGHQETRMQRGQSGEGGERSEKGSGVVEGRGVAGGRGRIKKDVRARYWAFLFENLERAVDEIYQTCESDESVVECKEVIMMLDSYTKDFKSLIDRLHTLKDFEKNTEEGNRPTSLAWELRMSSPGKSLSSPVKSVPPPGKSLASPGKSLSSSLNCGTSSGRMSSACKEAVVDERKGGGRVGVGGRGSVEGSTVARSLTFSHPSHTTKQQEQQQQRPQRQQPQQSNVIRSSGNSWADKVKGIRLSDPIRPLPSHARTNQSNAPTSSKPQLKSSMEDCKELSTLHSSDEGEGWETVQRTNKFRSSLPSVPPRHSSTAEESVKRLSAPLLMSSAEGDVGEGVGFKRSVSALVVNESKDVATMVCRTATSLVNVSVAENVPDRGQGGRIIEQRSRSPELIVKVSNVEGDRGSDKENRSGGKEDTEMREEISEDKVGERGETDANTKLVDDKRCAVLRETNTNVGLNKSLHVTDLSDMSEKHIEKNQENEKHVKTDKADEIKVCLTAEGAGEFCSDDEEADPEEIEIYKALRNAMEEEDDLVHLLDVEQQQALETATEAEQNYLLEIERQKSQEILLGDELEDTSEMVSTEETIEGEGEGLLVVAQGDSGKEEIDKINDDTQECEDFETMMRKYDAEAEQRKKTTWGDIVEEAESRGGLMGSETEARTPGRVVHVHEKLSSPSRKRSLTETRRVQEEKQAKARELRERLLQEKTEHLGMLARKVEEIQQWKNELLQQRRIAMDRKLERAEEKRQIQLQMKIRKAHEEENKAKEIEFIMSMEAQNKKHEIMAKHQESEARLLDIQEEKQRKHEERAAKEAAVEERRRCLEADRVSRLQDMQERRKQRESEFEQRQLEKERERLESARVREKEREERLQALNRQQHEHIVELQKKIQQRQDDTDRRHREKLEAIQEKAICMTILRHSTEDYNDTPVLVPYERKKFCAVCSVLIPSEVYLLSHLRGKKHQQAIIDSNNGIELSKQDIENFNLKHISDPPSDKPDPQVVSDRERCKALKKRCKKIRFRMTQRGVEYDALSSSKQNSNNCESENKTKLVKAIKELNKCLQGSQTTTGPWSQNKISSLDKSLGELRRILDKQGAGDQTSFRVYGGLTALCCLLEVSGLSSNLPPAIPNKSVVLACGVLSSGCNSSYDNCSYLISTNKITVLVDLLTHQLPLVVNDNHAGNQSAACNTTNNNTTPGGAGGGGAGGGVASGAGGSVRLANSPITALTETLAIILNTLASSRQSHEPANHGPARQVHDQSIANHSSSQQSNDKASNPSSMGSRTVLSTANDETNQQQPINDVISYIISIGVVDNMSSFLSNIHGPADCDSVVADFVQTVMSLITALIRLASRSSGTGCTLLDKKRMDDPTQLIVTLRVTQLVGVVSLMYGVLLHGDAPSRGEMCPQPLPPHTVAVATAGFIMLNHIAKLNLQLLQTALGEEGVSLEYRHIASYLLWYSSHCLNELLLHQVVLSIGYFTVLNRDNQVIIQSGQSPTVLQQLCSLPFPYFSDSRLTQVLFPTLISCCYLVQRNRDILEQELSSALLANYLEEKCLELQQQQHASSSDSSSVVAGAGGKKSKLNSGKDKQQCEMSLSSRFPVTSWQEAQLYFTAAPTPNTPTPPTPTPEISTEPPVTDNHNSSSLTLEDTTPFTRSNSNVVAAKNLHDINKTADNAVVCTDNAIICP